MAASSLYLSSAALSKAARTHDLLALNAALLGASACEDDEHLKGKTALMLASQQSGSEALAVVLALLATGSVGCALNRKDGKGRTALMLAARCGAHEVLQALIVAGADLEVLCARGESAWSKARRVGQERTGALLEAAGARNEQHLGSGDSHHARFQSGVESASVPFPMPHVSGCDATRFAKQYRGRMSVHLRGLVAGWPAATSWGTDRARLAYCVAGGAGKHLPLPVLRADGPGGRSVAADMRTPSDDFTLTVDECLSCALDASPLVVAMAPSSADAATTAGGAASEPAGSPDAGSSEPADVVDVAEELRLADFQPLDVPPLSVPSYFMCKLPLTPSLLGDLGAIPNALFGAPSAALRDEKRFWMSTRGAQTPLHFDHCHSVICQLVGRKRLTCFAPCDSIHLYPFPPPDGNVRTSRVDLWAWRFGASAARALEQQRFPNVACATPLECILSPGDVACTSTVSNPFVPRTQPLLRRVSDRDECLFASGGLRRRAAWLVALCGEPRRLGLGAAAIRHDECGTARYGSPMDTAGLGRAASTDRSSVATVCSGPRYDASEAAAPPATPAPAHALRTYGRSRAIDVTRLWESHPLCCERVVAGRGTPSAAPRTLAS